ncbi:unnamed protein product [Caenorhabditis sp. 36 PRJEB53466]|nr:unnamed protein product [Caenorhabditis sp. 36 PRJEB53466]
MRSFNGFVCEINNTHLKILDPIHNVVEVPVQKSIDSVRIGDYVEYAGPADILKPTISPDSAILDVSVSETNNIFIKTVAVAPIDAHLPADILKRYRRTVWSPYLQTVRDPQLIFLKANPRMEAAEVTVKFAPGPDGLHFEVVRVGELRATWKPALETLDAPWLQELYDREMANLCHLGRASFRLNQEQKLPANAYHTYGLVVARSVPNPYHFLSKNPEKCSLVYCQEIGVLRSMEVSNVKTGDWIVMTAKDRRYENKGGQAGNHFKTVTATKISVLHEKPVYTRVEGGQIECLTSFIYKPNDFESPENRKISNIDQRSLGFTKNAHFYDANLGKIEIYPTMIKQIVVTIENHRKTLGTEELSKRKDRKILIVVKVRLFTHFLAKYKLDPAGSLFFAHSVHCIQYHLGGEQICEQLEVGLQNLSI